MGRVSSYPIETDPTGGSVLGVKAGRTVLFPAGSFGSGAALDLVVTADQSVTTIKALVEGAAYRDVFFAPGVYAFGNSTIYLPPGCRVWALPGSVSITKVTANSHGFHSPVFDIVDAPNVTVDGLAFTKPPTTARELAIVVRATSAGATSNVHIRNSSFERMGLYVERLVWDTYIEDNLLDGDGAHSGGSLYGIATGGQIINGVGTNTDGLVERIYIRRNRILRQQSEAIDINWDTSSCWIEDNYMLNSNMDGDESNEAVDVGGGVCSDINVLNNEIVFDADAPRPCTGIHIKLSTLRARVTGNKIYTVNAIPVPVGAERHYGIYIDKSSGALVENNDVQGFHRGFVAAGPIAGLTVARNRSRKSALGEVLIAGASGNLILDVVITGNTLGDSTGNTESVVSLDYVQRGLVEANTIRGVGTQPAVRVRANNVDVQVCHNLRISNAQYGVQVDAGTVGTKVAWNNIRDMQRGGVFMSGASSEYWIGNNDVVNTNLGGGGFYAYTVEGAGGTIVDNMVRDDRASDSSKTTLLGYNIAATSDGCSWRGNKSRGMKSGSTNFNGLGNLTNLVA